MHKDAIGLLIMLCLLGTPIWINAHHQGEASKPIVQPVAYTQPLYDVEAFNALADSATKAYDMDKIMEAIKTTESHGNCSLVSKKGARGCYQTKVATEHNPGMGVEPLLHYSDKGQKIFATHYTDAMIQRYAVILSFAAYNGGIGTVDKAVNKAIAHLPKETRDYIKKTEKHFKAQQYASNED